MPAVQVVPYDMSSASCRAVDPDLFFSSGKGAWTTEQVDAAKRTCYTCPVRMQCLQWAIRADEREGIWGGLTPGERRKLRTRSQRK
jgi:WhiB family transcriptional regulator, redox-sensing transcriptional regulator